MEIIPFHENHPDFEKNLEIAVRELRAGGLVAVPTETVYGLAADAHNGLAIAKIFEAKNRPSFNPLIAHVANIEMAGSFGKIKPVHERLMSHFWPGPLTLVLDQQPTSNIHKLGCAGLETIAIRCPTGPVGNLITTFGQPIFAPSANRSGGVSPTTAQHVVVEFPDIDAIILDGGQCRGGIESTIIKVTTQEIVILRPGSVDQEQLQKVSEMPVTIFQEDGIISAPGMMRSHYAPNAVVRLNCSRPDFGAAFLNFGADNITTESEVELNLSEGGNLIEAASNLYSHIRKLDASGTKLICVAPIPETGLGLAINDRLRRAAAPRGQDD